MARTIDAALRWLNWVSLFLCMCLPACACITVYNKSDCSQALCFLLLRAYHMSANKIPDPFLSASHWLSQEAELLSSISLVTGSPWSNRLRLYPCTVAVTILVPSSEVLSGPVFSSLIHSLLALWELCHLTTLNTFYCFVVFFFFTELAPRRPPPSSSSSSPDSSSFLSSFIPMLKRLATEVFTGLHCCHLQSQLCCF